MGRAAVVMGIGLVAILSAQASAVAAQSPPRATIRSQSDLPATRFKLADKPSLAFSGPAFMTDTVPALRSEAERVLATARIEDPTVAQQLRAGLAAIAILQGRPEDADRLIAEQRAAEVKPQLQRLGLLLLDTAAASAQGGPDRGCATAAARLTSRLVGSDPAVIRDEAVARYSDVQTASVAYYAGAAVYMVDAQAETVGAVDLLGGLYMARWRVIAERTPACRAELSAAFRAWLDAPGNRVADIWPARDPDPALLARAKPVVVAVWESGFDPSLFPGQLAFDPAEPLDGRDNDGNGVVDDVHGPTYDPHFRPVPDMLPRLSPFLAGRLGLQMAVEKGQLDLNFGEDTADARFFAARARDASVAEQTEDMLGSSEFLARTHGTWVASVIADGAPFVRLYEIVAHPEAADPKPVPFTEDDARRYAALMPTLAARIRGAGVRIVNMSWHFTVDNLRDGLLDSGAETDPAKATQRAKVMFDLLAEPMRAVILDCPNTLFVAAAGNSNRPSEAAIPQGLDAPNLLVVGAAGANGRPTAFTTYGERVRLYARGEAVTVRAPGGLRMKSSGTSFSSPMTARAAAAMLAVNPRLTPKELVEGLLATATPGDRGMKLLHPGEAVRWASNAR